MIIDSREYLIRNKIIFDYLFIILIRNIAKEVSSVVGEQVLRRVSTVARL